MNPKNMDRREFLRRSLLAPAAASSLTAAAVAAGELLTPKDAIAASAAAPAQDAPMRFVLPRLPYPTDALEPHIDKLTMTIHHGAHHAGYVNNLNKLVAKYPQLAGKSAEELIKNPPLIPSAADRDGLRNNAGGHVNHTMFWEVMRPGGGGDPTGPIAEAIDREFGSFAFLRDLFNSIGGKRFGSGWVWLAQRPSGRLVVLSTPNQDNPMMAGGLYPLFGNDVWEHAYYLNYQNRRADYLKAWWNVINWEAVNRRLTMAPKQSG